MKKLVDVLKKWGVVIGAVLIAAMILGITAWAEGETTTETETTKPEYNVNLISKKPSWIPETNYTKAKIEIEAVGHGKKADYVPTVLFIGTMCNAHGMDGSGATLINSINSLAVKANVKYYLFNRYNFRGNDTSGFVNKIDREENNGLTDDEITAINKLNTNNHYALGKFLDCIYSDNKYTNSEGEKVDYDFIILEFDGSLIADRYGEIVHWQGNPEQIENVTATQNVTEVAQIMKRYYDKERVIWVCQDFNQQQSLGGGHWANYNWPGKDEKLGYYLTRYYSDHNNGNKRVWEKLDYERNDSGYFSKKTGYDQYKTLAALIAPDLYGNITYETADNLPETALPSTRQTNYSNVENLESFLNDAIDSLYYYELTFTDKIKVADGCAYDSKNSYFMVKNAEGNYVEIPSDSTQYPNTIIYDSETNTVTGTIKELCYDKEVKLVIGLDLADSESRSFKKTTLTGNVNDGDATVTITPNGEKEPTDSASKGPDNVLDWPIEIKYEVEESANSEYCKVSIPKEPGETGERIGLWTDTGSDLIKGSTASAGSHWAFINWTHKEGDEDKEVGTEKTYMPSQNSEGRNVADTYTAHFKFLGSVTKTVDKEKAASGESLKYTITLGNESDVDCKNVSLTDTIPLDYFEADSIKVTGPDGNEITVDETTGTFKVEGITVEANKTLKYTVRATLKESLKETLTEDTEVNNTAHADFGEKQLESTATTVVNPVGVILSYKVEGDPNHGIPEEKVAPPSQRQYYGTDFPIAGRFATTWETSDGTEDGTPGEWVFTGWCEDEEYKNVIDESFLTLTEDKTLYGKWEFVSGCRGLIVDKFWSDGAEKHKNNKVTIGLYADDELIDSVILSADNDWTYEWTKLPIESKDGKIVTYTVKETVGIRDYVATVEEVEDGYFIVTNKIVEKPKTGDSNNYIAFIVIGLLALVAIGVVVWTFTRRKK